MHTTLSDVLKNGVSKPDAAGTLVSKFCDHQPLHRQSVIYGR